MRVLHRPVFALDRRFDMLPKVVGRLHDGEQLAGGLGDGLEIGKQGAAKLAVLKMCGWRADLSPEPISSGNWAWNSAQLMLVRILRSWLRLLPGLARSASRSFSRALCNWDLLLPIEQSSMEAISLCS